MKQLHKIPNYRLIRAKVLPPTNHRPIRVKIYELERFADEQRQSITLSFNQATNEHINEFIYRILTEAGFNVIARASDIDHYMFICDNWGEEYINLKDLKR